ncbi:MAG TPA: hypothetical protein VK943_02510, partial [Arenibaculum sp.]|nr:hypothetical protein [Arenibaculum sp.]
MVEALAWHNGRVLPVEEASPSAASMSLNMGLAVFDGLMAYRNDGDYRLHAAAEHFERLRTGSTRMGFPISWTVPQLIGAVRELLAQVPPATYYVRPIVYRGARHLWLTGIDDIPVDTTIVVAPVGRDVDAGLRVGFSPVQRVSSHAVPVSWKI